MLSKKESSGGSDAMQATSDDERDVPIVNCARKS